MNNTSKQLRFPDEFVTRVRVFIKRNNQEVYSQLSLSLFDEAQDKDE